MEILKKFRDGTVMVQTADKRQMIIPESEYKTAMVKHYNRIEFGYAIHKILKERYPLCTFDIDVISPFNFFGEVPFINMRLIMNDRRVLLWDNSSEFQLIGIEAKTIDEIDEWLRSEMEQVFAVIEEHEHRRCSQEYDYFVQTYLKQAL